MIKWVKNNKILFMVFVIQIVTLMIALGGYLKCKSNLYSEIFLPSDFNVTSEEVIDERIVLTPDNAEKGRKISMEPITLNRGTYIVYLDYSVTGAGNIFEASCFSSVEYKYRSNPVKLSMHNKNTYLTIDIGNTKEDVVLSIDYSGVGGMEIYGLSIHETTEMAKRDFVYALMFCAFLSLMYFVYSKDLTKRKEFFCLGVIVFFASCPLFLDYLIIGHDIPFHLNRIDSIKIGLQQGTFPVKIQPFWIYDYGYASGVFYGDFLLYFPALLRLMGMSIQEAYMIFVVAINIGTTLISYFGFKKILESDKLGMLAAMIYTLSNYRLINVYTRAAVGEYCAMMFLPLVFVGFYQIFNHTKATKLECVKLAIIPAIGLAGIINTHILTCEMVAVVIALVCIILIKKIFSGKTFWILLLTAFLTLLLSAGFLVPFLDYYLTEDFIINSSEWQTGNVQNMGLYFTQIFGVLQDGVGASRVTTTGVYEEMSPGLGLPLIIGWIASGYYLFIVEKEKRKNTTYYTILICFVGGLLCMIMSSIHFPWSTLENLGSLGRAFVSSIQFPWRFLSLATLFVTVGSCFLLKQLLQREAEGSKKYGLILWPMTLVTLGVTTLISMGWYYHSFLSEGIPYRVYDTYELPSMQIYTAEYLPEGSKLENFYEMRYAVSPGMMLSDIQKEGTKIQCYVDNVSEDGYLEVPLVNYKGYVAKDVDKNVPLTIENGNNNCIRVEIPADFMGNIEICFRHPIYWRIAEIITTVSIILLVGFGMYSYKLKKKKLLMYQAEKAK